MGGIGIDKRLSTDTYLALSIDFHLMLSPQPILLYGHT